MSLFNWLLSLTMGFLRLLLDPWLQLLLHIFGYELGAGPGCSSCKPEASSSSNAKSHPCLSVFHQSVLEQELRNEKAVTEYNHVRFKFKNEAKPFLGGKRGGKDERYQVLMWQMLWTS